MNCNSPIAKEIREYLKSNLAVGNERSARCKKFSQSGTTIDMEFDVISKHNVGFPVGVIYDATFTVSAKLNLLQPNPKDVKICAKVPLGGDLCISASDLIAIITGSAVAGLEVMNEAGMDTAKLTELAASFQGPADSNFE